MKKKNNTINVNKIIFVVLVLSFFAISLKLLIVGLAKTTDGINLTEFVANRNTQKDIIKANRGSILSADGELLAQSINSYTVIAYLSPSRTSDEKNPHHVVNKQLTAEKLSVVLNMPKENILALLNKDLYQVELGPQGRGITESTKKQIEALELPGIDFIDTTKRYYKMGTFASYILGYAQNDDSGNMIGKMGVELYYDDKLQGQDGYIMSQKDAYGYSIPNTSSITVDAEHGQDIYLTIDSKIQMFVENAIKELSDNNEMEWLTFTIADAKTGAIVASGSNPTFNPNELVISSYLNPLTSYTYEPGSTMKIYSFLAAMEAGIYDGNKTYMSGTIKVDDATIKDFNGHGWGEITFDSGFSYSSNVAATNLALEMGREKLYNYYSSLGFGKKTGITLPHEYPGNIDFTYRTEIATASFGQGITTTPIQNIQALTILANSGVELQPYIVEKIVNSQTGEETYTHKKTELGQKASKENIEKMLSMMYDVVYSGKTDAKYYKTESVKLVGKTGTAQITGANGQYMTGQYDYVRSFAGVFPYENPQYLIYVSVKKFNGAYKDFAHMVTKVVEEIAKYKNLSELIKSIDNNKIVTMENFISSDITLAEEKLKQLNLNVIKLGNGKFIINQYPEKGQIILSGNKVFLVSNSSEYTMPDITSWSRNEVETLCKLLKIDYIINGSGNVESYNIPAGTILTSETKLEISLK